MRILMLNNEYPPIGGGTGTVNEAILKVFASTSDFEIDLITSSPNEQFKEGYLFDRYRIFLLPVNRYNIHHASNGELLRYAWKALRFALKLIRERTYDLCFAWSAVPAGGVAWALHRLVGMPYIVRVMGPDIPGFEMRYGHLYPLLKPAIRSVFLKATIVIAKCEEEAQLIRKTAPDINIQIIPNGVDQARFNIKRVNQRGLLRILCVGRLIERKGQGDLISAIRILKRNSINVHCRFVGAGDSESSYRELVKKFGLEKEIDFSGYVPREQMPHVYAEADIFVLPSYNEGMSVAALEARAAGLPLVLSRTGGSSQIVIEGRNGWTFAIGDVADLARILTEAARYRKILNRYRSESLSLAGDSTWDLVAQAYRKLLSQFN